MKGFGSAGWTTVHHSPLLERFIVLVVVLVVVHRVVMVDAVVVDSGVPASFFGRVRRSGGGGSRTRHTGWTLGNYHDSVTVLVPSTTPSTTSTRRG